ncbi:MAG TPA: metalloregulator ArsR/SmtB family transcription factor [Candidatus Saccharimonadales bacterium]|jgi:DNA-binding transcriptional ArsR family regulator|nr:metalloregulator ArsR/SmtB family transcription factor [Candidatus Saccharimonadales bacterium]
MDEALRAIAEPRRRAILRLVWQDERTVGDIASHFDVTRPAISQHLRVLADAGLVTLRRDGRRSIYRAKRGAMQDLRAYLGAFWDVELAGLKAAAERAEREKGSHEQRRRRH